MGTQTNRVATGNYRRAAGATYRRRRVRSLEHHTLGGKGVYVGRFYQRLAIASVSRILVFDVYPEDVGSFIRHGCLTVDAFRELLQATLRVTSPAGRSSHARSGWQTLLRGSIQSGPSSPISGVVPHPGRCRAGHILIAVTGDPGRATPTCVPQRVCPRPKRSICPPAGMRNSLARAVDETYRERPMTKPLAVITGASAGIGAAIARALSAAGHPLLLTARRVDRLRELDLPDTVCRQNDVADVEGFRAAVAEAEEVHGPVDLLVNNAGWLNLAAFKDQEPDHWQGMFETNVVGLLNTTSVVFSPMLERRAGTIINIGSTAGHRYGPNHVVYVGTKFAVRGLTEGLRAEAAGRGVRVVLISPGLVDTELLNRSTQVDLIEAYQANKDRLRGGLRPDDVAGAVLFAYQQPPEITVRELIIAPTASGT